MCGISLNSRYGFVVCINGAGLGIDIDLSHLAQLTLAGHRQHHGDAPAQLLIDDKLRLTSAQQVANLRYDKAVDLLPNGQRSNENLA